MREKKYCTKCNKELWFTNKNGLCTYCCPVRKEVEFQSCKYCGKQIRMCNKRQACTECAEKHLNKLYVKERRKKLNIDENDNLKGLIKCKCGQVHKEDMQCLPCKRAKEDNYKEL
jgi:hypothetical protein